MTNLNPDDSRSVLAALMLSDHPLPIPEIAEFVGLSEGTVKDQVLYLKARGMLLPQVESGNLCWKLQPQVLTYTEGLKGVPRALNYQRSKRITANRIARGSQPPANKKL